MSRKTLRFTPADIVRAIDGFEAAGLQVCGVEITPTGIIKMTGGTHLDLAAEKTTTNTNANPMTRPSQ